MIFVDMNPCLDLIFFSSPYRVLYSTTVEPYTSGMIESEFPAYWFFNFFLYLLLVLHLLWSYSIFRIVYRKVIKGNVSTDLGCNDSPNYDRA